MPKKSPQSILGLPDSLFAQMDGPPVVMDDTYFNDNFNTKLSPKQEAAYRQWAETNNRMQDSADYDMRGAWLANSGQASNGHYPDTFKKPNHPTFSSQSRYHNTPSPNGGSFVGGDWGRTPDGRDTFTPSREMIAQHGYLTFMQQKYMPEVEPNSVFILDRVKR